jgi:hypothetical protein
MLIDPKNREIRQMEGEIEVKVNEYQWILVRKRGFQLEYQWVIKVWQFMDLYRLSEYD